jgi:HAMP domain-containing protein
MFAPIKRKLSLKLSIALAVIIIPPMVAAAYFIAAQQTSNLEQLTLATAQIAAKSGGKAYALALESGIDSGLFTVGDLFDPVYEEIKGFDFGENPRFHTKYDFYCDRVVTGFQDEILDSSPDYLYAVGVDVNGYLPTHNGRFSAPLTGDRVKDLGGNRTKRKFDNPVGINAARNLKPVLLQEYHRDVGDTVWDVSVPLYVKGQHYGAFRVAVSFAALAAHKRTLLLQLSALFGLLVIITVGFIFIMLRRSMKPLGRLAELANQISTGENLETPIKPGTTDEIGQMAKSMNRLRTSLQVAMSRLGE